MKRICALFLIFTMLLAATACSQQAGPAETLASVQTHAPNTAVVTFADPVLEARVRAAMGIPEGDITASEAEAVTEMYFGIEWQTDVSEETQITDLGGLEYFKNLKILNLSSNAITDISPLTGLTKLTSLILAGNPVDDISPLSGMTSLEKLSLSGCEADDYSLLAGLNSLELLILDDSAITDLSVLSYLTGLTYLSLKDTQVIDVSPLAGLYSLTQLYLAECPVDDYSPLADIYTNLEGKDFTVPSSLEELGFTWPENDAVAEYRGEGMSVTVNHSEWGAPGMEDQNNAVKMNLQMDNGYGLTIIYYPKIDVYVFQMTLNNEMIMNYIYEEATGGFSLNASDRESVEQVIKDALGDTGSGDILLAPIPVFNDTIRETFGMTADALFALPFDEADNTLPSPYERLGFTLLDYKATCLYEEQTPHYLSVEVHRTEWDENAPAENLVDWSMAFIDSDVNGYQLQILYYEADGLYRVSVEKDGVEAGFETRPATGERGWEFPDLDTAHRMFNDAFGTKGKELYDKPLAYFEQVVQERFGISIDELYALPVR